MNMRKIIAVLAAALMLCAIVPMAAMSVSAAPGDVIIDADFNDGMDGFNNFSVADGALVLDGTSADWANSYTYANAIKPNTTYQVNFRAKADANKALSFKINNGWSGTNVQASANITTEWAEYELLLTPDSNLTSPIFTIQTGTYAYEGTVYYIDYVKVTEYQDPADIGKVINGSFEDGTANWKTDSSASLYTADAYEGSNSLKLSNTGYYASAATQTVPVKANTVYELSWKSKRLSGNGAFNVILCQPVSPYTNYTKVAGQNWMNETSGNWVNNSFTINTGDNTSMLIKWTSELSGTAGEILLDDIRLIEVKDPSYDGYIYNGDFETGKLGFGTGQVSTLGAWYNLWGSTSHELVAGYNSDYALKGTASGAYNITYQNVAVEPNTDYIVCAYSKDSSDSRLWIKNANGNGDITNAAFNSGSDWALTTVKFNSGSNSTVWVGLMGVSAGSTYTVDNVTMFKALPVSNDDYLSNTNFEGGSISGWSVIWSDQVSASIVPGGKDDNFAVYVAGKPDHNYGQLRQTVTVEPNTDYKVTVWAKNSTGMSLLVKHGNDSGNINNVSASAGDEWTLITNEFNSGSNTTVLVGVMEDGNGYGTFDGFLMEKKHVCEIVELERVDATCGADGYVKYGCECGEGVYTETLTATGEHTYDHEFDTDCNVCGAVRAVVAPVIEVKLSISEDVNGLAFRFEANVAGFAIKAGTFVQADYTNATYNGYKLIETGAIASNGVSSIEIKGERMCDLDENGKALFAYRITNIPEEHKADEITMTPYYVVEIDGEQVTIYGEAQAGAYAEVAIG